MAGMAHGTCCQAQTGRLIKFLFQNNHNFSFGPPKGYPALKLRFVGFVPRTISIGAWDAPYDILH